MYGSDCKPAEDRGVSVMHGNRAVFHNDKQPAFKAIYEAVRNVSMAVLHLLVVLYPYVFMQTHISSLLIYAYITQCNVNVNWLEVK